MNKKNIISRARTTWSAGMICAGALAGAGLLQTSHGVTNDLATALQQGLFEEEANHNYPAAIQAYELVISRFDENRKFAVTALFRLAECYRVLNKTNQAVRGYERITTEFADQTNLVTLAGQSLVRLGIVAQGEALNSRLPEIRRMPKEEQRIAVQQEFGNPVLTSLMQKSAEAQVELAGFQHEFGPENVTVLTAKAKLESLNKQIDAQVEATLRTLEAKGSNLSSPTPGKSQAFAENDLAKREEAQELARIQRLLKESPDLLDTPNNVGMKPIHVAAQKGQIPVVSFLLDHGVDVESRTSVGSGILVMRTGSTALKVAAFFGSKAMVDFLIHQKAELNAADDEGGTPLHVAASKGFKTIVETLLMAGAKMDAVDRRGRTPLHDAVESGSLNIVDLLLQKGADVNASDNNKITPLVLAIAQQQIAIFQKMLDSNADVNVLARTPENLRANQVDRYPLHIAVLVQNAQMVEALLKKGARPDAREWDASNGNTPLLLAASRPQETIVGTLLEHGADPNLKDSEGKTALHFGVLNRNLKSVNLLLNAHADPNVPDHNLLTPLQLASAKGSEEIVKTLIAHHANVETRGFNGETPLGSAIGGNALGSVKLLIQAGANVNARTADGKSPLDLARFRREIEIETYLREHGARDDWTNPDAITLRRGTLAKQVFLKNTNNWNHFTLFELIGVQYGFLRPSPEEVISPPNMPIQANNFPFPDLQHVRIQPSKVDSANPTNETVDLKARLEAADCHAMPLQWGDSVEIPETVHLLNENWPGFNEQQAKKLCACLARQILLVVRGNTNVLHLGPESVANGRLITTSSFYLTPVVKGSHLLLSTSDLSRIQVIRPAQGTEPKLEWTMDCEKANPDFWLRDEDIIIVPEKN